METKFTPGPWVLTWHRKYKQWNVFGPSGAGEAVVSHNVHEESGRAHAEHEANMRLMAAAPELFEALEKLLRSYRFIKPEHSMVSDAEKQAVSAVARATGEQS